MQQTASLAELLPAGGVTMGPQELLEKYNPTLVLLPQDSARHRPWSKWWETVDEPRGDYHPCKVEFFLSHLVQRDEPRPWRPWFLKEPVQTEPLGLEALRQLAVSSSPEETMHWELDLGPIRSQKAEAAWETYGQMLAAQPWDAPSYVYARYVGGPPAVLEYWYLYVYNDAPNRHEGDWENVAIELDASEQPVRAGYAGHSSGFVRAWERVEKRNGHPLLYVSRGSHAAYFEHKPEGHRTNSLSPRKGWPEPLDSLYALSVRSVQRIMWRLRFVDRTASNPESPIGHPRDLGVPLEPEMIVFPEVETGQASEDFWWMRLLCRWGSRHSRLSGTIGPNPPWQQTDKWAHPSQWMDGLVPD